MDPFLSRLPYSAPLHSAYSASRTLTAPAGDRRDPQAPTQAQPTASMPARGTACRQCTGLGTRGMSTALEKRGYPIRLPSRRLAHANDARTPN